MSSKHIKRAFNNVVSFLCENCTAVERKHKLVISNLQETIKQLRKQVIILQDRSAALQHHVATFQQSHTPEFAQSFDVQSDSPTPQQLLVENLGNYYAEMLVKYPVLNELLRFFFSQHQQRKDNAADTSDKWRNAYTLYKCFIIDTFLKSKNKQAVLRTHYLLGTYFHLAKVSNSVWQVLMRLRIVPSRTVIANWVKSQPLHKIDPEKILLYSFDNCDIHQHVTHVRTEHRSTMLHLVTQFVLEIPCTSAISAADLWKTYSVSNFANWVQASDIKCRTLANAAAIAMTKSTTLPGLKFAMVEDSQTISRSHFTVLPPALNRQTSSYTDIRYVLANFYKEHLVMSEQAFAFVQGDEQVFTLCWLLKVRNPTEFLWMVPVAAEWHWTWHILKAIYRLWGTFILFPLSQILNYSNLDLKCDNFHYGEDFLELVTLAITSWYMNLARKHPTMTPTDILHHYKMNSQVYELLYAFIYYFAPYWLTRSAVKCGDAALLTKLWRYWLHIFIATGKYRYARMTIRFLWILHTIDEDVLQIYNSNRVFSFSGGKGTGIAIDAVNEMVRFCV
jgi:hypothetical protein